MTRFRDDWPQEAVVRFWNHQTSHPELAAPYFSRQVGRGIVGLALRQGVLADGSTVLDLGCGPGYLAEHLLEAGCEVWGVDSADASIAEANRRLDRRPGWHGASHDPPGQAFDAVTCIETIEHLSDALLSSTFKTIREHLRPGGAAFLTTPNDEDIRAAVVYCPFCDHEFHSMQHVRSFTAETLRARLEGAGFAVPFCEAVHLMAYAPFRVHADMPRYTLHQALLRTRMRTGIRVDATVPRPHLCAVATRPIASG
jgi:2-polyprenyl-3-methyl-5-hydroxy-6-metoxy-1,4-benzoquinol methylase